MSLVIACVQRAGKIWVIVVRETVWSQFSVGLPSDWTCVILYYVNRNDIYICIINGLGLAQYKMNYWTLPSVNHRLPFDFIESFTTTYLRSLLAKLGRSTILPTTGSSRRGGPTGQCVNSVYKGVVNEANPQDRV